MREFILSMYLKSQMLKQRCVRIFTLLQFIKFVITNGLFGTGEPKNSLRILQEYLELEAYSYPASTLLKRDVNGSVALFSVLVDKYLESNSDVILEQLLEVYKEEVVRREENVK